MQVQDMPISSIHPYENNPRNNDNAVSAVAASLKEFGWQQPIVVDKDMVIIAGHTRYKAALSLGMNTVPVLVADKLSPEKANAYRLADNKTGDLATWDFAKLQEELDALEDDEFDMSPFGFDIEPLASVGFGGGEDETKEYGEDDFTDGFTCECPECGYQFDP